MCKNTAIVSRKKIQFLAIFYNRKGILNRFIRLNHKNGENSPPKKIINNLENHWVQV
jgi:hypothetical protein